MLDSKIKTLEEKILDIILPKKCLGCSKEGSFLCNDCLKLIAINSWQVCPVCQESLTEFGEICRYCKSQNPPIDGLTTASDYKDPLVSKLIHAYKYKFTQELASPLSEILIKSFNKNKLIIPDVIIPIPLHPLRLRWRGFNQSELIARELGRKLLIGFSIKVDTKTLSRTRYTPAQASLKKSIDRQNNIKNAFQVESARIDKIKNKKILLIDDICTTGGTLFEAGKQLRELKPKSIQALVIARQK